MVRNAHYCPTRPALGPSQPPGRRLKSPFPSCSRGCTADRRALSCDTTQPAREWEIVSLKIGCPLLWLSLPSVPRAQGWRSSRKQPEKQWYFWRWRSGMQRVGPRLTSRFSERAFSVMFSTGVATWAPRMSCESAELHSPTRLSLADLWLKPTHSSWDRILSREEHRSHHRSPSWSPSRITTTLFAYTAHGSLISGWRKQPFHTAKPHRTVFNRNFIDV